MHTNSLILTITRACNVRCAYCPTVKQGWPSLSIADSYRAIDLFLELFREGDIKLFGGEPLLEPTVVRAVLEYTKDIVHIQHVYLSTNAIGLNEDWLEYLAGHPKVILTISLDGAPQHHRKLRPSIVDGEDSYTKIQQLLPLLHRVPRLVITQTIAPSTAKYAYENFLHIVDLGFKKFNFLPGYFIPWNEKQLSELRKGFSNIARYIIQKWRKNEYLYVRNLFIQAPMPFFNQGMIVDADGSIHPSNITLSGSFANLHAQTKVGTLKEPPTVDIIQEKAKDIVPLVQSAIAEKIWDATMASDAELTRFCDRLLPEFLLYRKHKKHKIEE